MVGGAIQSQGRPATGTGERPLLTARSLLIVDCGSVYTKVALLSRVEDRYRLVARGQAPTTVAPPVADLAVGVREALAAIERITGRVLQRDGRILTPEQDDGAGVDGVALSTSVGGPLRILTSGPGREALAGLVHRSIGGLFVQLDALPTPSGGGPGADIEWQQMLAQVRTLHPHAVLVVGSPFGGARAQSSIGEVAASVGHWLDALRAPTTSPDRQVGQEHSPLPVVFTGNTADGAELAAALRERTSSIQAVEALSPSTLAPLNRAVNSLYEVTVLRQVPGYATVRAMSSTAPAATLTALTGMVRYLAQHFQTNVVGADVGASSTALAGATASGEFVPATHPQAGVGPGIGQILRAVGAQNVLRWLSVPASEDELREYALGRMLRPRSLPATPRELEFEHAAAREAIQLALRAPGSRLAGLHPMDVVLGTGGVLSNVAHPAMAALILLDALQPRGITSLVLDTGHIANMLGSVAALDMAAAAEVAESDAVPLQLGTVISTSGAVPDGQPAVRVVLEFADGRRHIEDVVQGQLICLPLALGEQALLGLYPAPTIDVGLGAGQHARASEPIEGGALGLIVDVRGRPVALPQDTAARIARIAQWRRALGLEA